MSETPLVSIIIRTKNRGFFLKRAIESITSQTFKRWKAYIINDGGTDDYHDVVKPYIDKGLLNNFIFADVPISSGRGGALSIGISISKEKYILIHDDDDTLEPDFLTKTVNYLEDDDEDVFAGVSTSNYDVYEEVKDERIIVNKKTDSFGLRQGSIVDFGMYISNIGINIAGAMPPICFLFKRDFVKKSGGPNISMNYAEDYDFFIRLMQYGEFGIISDFLCSYHHRPPIGTSADKSCYEKRKYDPIAAYRNNIVREAMTSKNALKCYQSHFMYERQIASHLDARISALAQQFSQLTAVLQEFIVKTHKTE